MTPQEEQALRASIARQQTENARLEATIAGLRAKEGQVDDRAVAAQEVQLKEVFQQLGLTSSAAAQAARGRG